MNNWVFSSSIIAFLGCFISLILPDGRMKKFINAILVIICSLVVFSPLFKYFSKNDGYEFIWGEQVQFQQDYLNYVNQENCKKIVKNCKDILLNNGINDVEVDISFIDDQRGGFTIISLHVDLTKAKFNQAKPENIKDFVSDLISKQLNVDKSIIRVTL